MLRFSSLSALLLAALAAPVAAEEDQISQAISAGSLHDGPLDMVAYYTELPGGAFEVVATFAEPDGSAPMRVMMAMADGDALRFGLPGHRGALYGFSRAGNVLTVSVDPVPTKEASATAPLTVPSKL